jgi:hypothetical protein
MHVLMLVFHVATLMSNPPYGILDKETLKSFFFIKEDENGTATPW